MAIEQSPTLGSGAGGNTVPAVVFPIDGRNAMRDPEKHDASEDGTGRGTPVVAHGFYSTDGTHGVHMEPEISPAVKVGSGLGIPSPPAVAMEVAQVQWASGGGQMENPTAQALRSSAEHNYQFVRNRMVVRRLTPTECERLQGFPDGWTQIGTADKPTADSHRYKQLGNAVTVNVAEWIARRAMKALKGEA